MNPILGIDIGGTKTAVVVGSAEGKVLRRAAFPTNPEKGFDDFLSRLERVVREVKGDAALRAGISVGGPLDAETGTLHAPPHLPSWEGVALRDHIAELLNMPTAIMHDARAGALAEYRFGLGAARPGLRGLAFLTFATGFGCGVVLDGHVLPIPGEIGHWRVAEDGPEMFGKRGSLEGLASGAGIEAHARATGLFKDCTVPALAEAARGGNDQAIGLFRDVAEQVGRQCARLVDFLGVEIIALGTIGVHCGDLLLDPIREVFQREALSHLAEGCLIQPSGLGDKLGDVAALAIALEGAPASVLGRAPGVRAQLDALGAMQRTLSRDSTFVASVERAAKAIETALRKGNKVMTAGNGGSATDASHLAEELIGRFRGNRVALPAISLVADGSTLTCIANDFGFDEIFARQIEGLGQRGDVFVGFTTSGNSPNINRALKAARDKGLVTIALTGKEGGEARRVADICVHVPLSATERIQEAHTFVLHAICEHIEQEFG